MEVASFIREYLYKQDYLDVPGLGTFFLSKDPFSVDNPQNKIKPSVKTLIFRENSRVGGDSLIHFIARRKQISLDEAKIAVYQFTEEIKTLVNRKGTADIMGFGKFTSNDGINLDFKAHPNNYSAISFGLGELNLPPLEKPREKQENFSNQPPKPPTPPIANTPIVDTPTFQTDSFLKEEVKQDIPINPLPAQETVKPNEPNEFEKIQEEIRQQASRLSNLPTAEELYKTYHFTPDKPKAESFNPPLEDPKPLVEEFKAPVYEPAPTYTPPLEEKKEEIILPTPIIENPLSYSHTEPLRVVQNQDNNYSNLPHPPVFEPIENENENPDIEYGKSKNFIWVWILSTFFLLATLAGLGYIERARVLKQIHSSLPGVKIFDFLDTNPKVKPIDSSLIKKHILAQQDSIKEKAKQDSLKALDTLKKSPGNDTLATLKPKTSADSSGLIIKSLNETQQFLVVGGDFNLEGIAKSFGKKYSKKQINYIIVDAHKESIKIAEKNPFGDEPLNRPAKYFVCLGEYATRDLAALKIEELMISKNFKGFAKPYIFDKSKPHNPYKP